MTTLPLLGDQLRLHQLFEMKGEGGVSHFRCADEFRGGSPRRARSNEVPKEVKTSRLREGSECSSSSFDVHISIVFEILLKFDERNPVIG